MVGGVRQSEGLGGQQAPRASAERKGKLLPRRNRSVDPIDLKVPVVFSRCIGAYEAASLLAEVLRHVMFMRGQIPMPYRQLLETLEAREALDKASKEMKASRLSEESRKAKDPSAPEHAEAKADRKKAKGKRSLSKVPAHRRARKIVEGLETTTLRIHEAFVDAAEKGRPVREALILLGASYLSPRELYTVTFPPPMDVRVDTVGVAQDVTDVYSRKLVRSLVGGMSGVTLRRLAPSRVHVFLRIRDRSPSPEGTPTAPDIAAARVHVAGHLGAQEAVQPLQAPQEALLHLTPRPRFMVRVTKSRPVPRVTVGISKLVEPDSHASTDRSGERGGGSNYSILSDRERQPLPDGDGITASNTGCQGIGGESPVCQDGVFREDKQRSMRMEGVRGCQEGWYQLSCGRLAGMKGGVDCLSS